MTVELAHVDATNDPALRDLAREIRRTGIPRVLMVDGEAVAIMVPTAPRPSIVPRDPDLVRRVLAEVATTFATVDVDRLKKDLREQRRQRTTARPVDE